MDELLENEIIESLHNGQFKQAKAQLSNGCKTKPTLMAQRLGEIVGVLHRAGQQEMAARFVNLFHD